MARGHPNYAVAGIKRSALHAADSLVGAKLAALTPFLAINRSARFDARLRGQSASFDARHRVI
jgi:hypothetical protein